jgi:hypothetical protein
MKSQKPHKKLDVWKISIELVVEIYKLTDALPAIENMVWYHR